MTSSYFSRELKFVYFAQADIGKRFADSGPVKIGSCKVPVTRIVGLSKEAGVKLRFVALTVGCMRDELEIHKHFAADRIAGEWFHPSRAIGRLISKINVYGKIPKELKWVEPSPVVRKPRNGKWNARSGPNPKASETKRRKFAEELPAKMAARAKLSDMFAECRRAA